VGARLQTAHLLAYYLKVTNTALTQLARLARSLMVAGASLTDRHAWDVVTLAIG